MEAFDGAVPGRDAMGVGTTEGESQHWQHHSDSFIEDRGESKALDAQKAANAAEDDLREARRGLKTVILAGVYSVNGVSFGDTLLEPTKFEPST